MVKQRTQIRSKKHPALITPKQLQEKPIPFLVIEELKEESLSRSQKMGPRKKPRSTSTNQHQHQAQTRSSKTRTARGGPVLIGYDLSCFTPEQLQEMPIAYSSYIHDDDEIEEVVKHSQTEHLQTNTTESSDVGMLSSKVDAMQQQLNIAISEIKKLTYVLEATRKDNLRNVQHIAPSEHEANPMNLNDAEERGSNCSNGLLLPLMTSTQVALEEDSSDVEYEWLQI